MSNVINYGSALQTFATQKLLTSLGFQCDVINYIYPNRWHRKEENVRLTFADRMVRQLKKIISRTLRPFRKKSEWDIKMANINRFCTDNLNLTRKFTTLRQLEKHDWSGYSYIAVGSDQVWNPKYMKGDKAFLLSFVEYIPKISISSSFGCDVIDPEYEKRYRYFLTKFKSLSVRENNGIEIIRSLGVKSQVKLLLDPTLLLSGAEWAECLQLGASTDTQPYILVYILRYAVNPGNIIGKAVRMLQEKYNCKALFLGEIHEEDMACVPNSKRLESIKVAEFVSLFKNAKAVVTTSFHGTAFAINFGRPLISITPSAKDDRQSTLLKSLGLTSCMLNEYGSINEVIAEYDTVKQQERLSQIRQDNLEWLKENSI